MNTVTSPTGFRIITAEEAEERFAVSDGVGYPYQDFADEQEIRLYESGLRIEGDLAPESDVDRVPYNVIVDGDLTVDGDMTWWDEGSGNFLLVTGDARARNVLLSGCPNVVVRGDVTVAGGIQGSCGEGGGYLAVRGRTRARVVVATLYFGLDLTRRPEAVLIANPHRSTCPVDFTEEESAGVVLAELLDADGGIDVRKVGEALREGRPVLRPDVPRPERLAAVGRG
ncbi:hypothetical protein [Wenjunlia tyrosinilytica]|uniref:Uncharacterized protein n=1 Tax=Wenjunlia tyrosinilytica TaxID=1544741 RepID=A0A918E0U0_9ACTN|nr:hypothetical protein [Wenjunlia tyrosinilytica]GGO95634.1 hypothetical protein GCM10012280_53280 [Wenjunlia tyrosinilytica]